MMVVNTTKQTECALQSNK